MNDLKLVYTLLCDDVRIEMGNKISLMGIFQNIMVEKLPISLIKFAVINHWTGSGRYDTEVRILSPDRQGEREGVERCVTGHSRAPAMSEER